MIGMPGYQISSDGRVCQDRMYYRRPLIPVSRNGHYKYVNVTINGKPAIRDVHRLVALTFHPNPEGKPEAHHIDGDIFNNSASNLRWVTRSENRMERERMRTPEKRKKELEWKMIKRSLQPQKPVTNSGTEHDARVPGLQLRHRASRSSWHLYFRLDGREHRPKIGDARIMTRAQARQIALQWLAEIAHGRHPKPDIDRRTVADLRRRYDEIHAPRKKPSSQSGDRHLWDTYILPVLGRHDVAKISQADINDLHHAMRAKPYAANRAVALLHKAFELAITWGWRIDNPVRVERYREQKRRRVPSADETALLLAALDRMRTEQPWFVGMVELLLFTGCRLREIMNARWDYVSDGALHLPDSKTGQKTIPLNQPAREALARIPRIVGNPHIICGRERGPLVGHFKHWRRLLQQAGIQDLRIHDLRRLYVSTSLSAGVPLDQIGQVVGHASIATTRGYAYLQTDAARLAAEMAGAQFDRLRKKNPAGAG